jgi:peptidoglycan hydrolase CwlO-like protein
MKNENPLESYLKSQIKMLERQLQENQEAFAKNFHRAMSHYGKDTFMISHQLEHYKTLENIIQGVPDQIAAIMDYRNDLEKRTKKSYNVIENYTDQIAMITSVFRHQSNLTFLENVTIEKLESLFK